MLLALDLTARQASRVLAQAVRTRARLEIEPRPEMCPDLLWGTLVSGEDELLRVELHDRGPHTPRFAGLIGAACDVRTMIAGELYLFSTFIVDAADHTVPLRLVLALPPNVQVANRRRMVRRQPVEPVPVRLQLATSRQPFMGELANIGHGGIGCRVRRNDVGEWLLVGDGLHVEFVLPWSGESFNLPTTVCGKNAGPDPEQLLVGFEFPTAPDEAAAAELERLRRALASETARLSEMNGDL